MRTVSDFVQITSQDGATTQVGGRQVTPQAQAVIVRWPGGGWVWNRPVAVWVKQGGARRRLPIRDRTRLIQVGLAMACVLCYGLLSLTIFREGKS